MLVVEEHEVVGEYVIVGLREAREGEGYGDEVSGCWVGGVGWLVGAEGATVETGGAELIAEQGRRVC